MDDDSQNQSAVEGVRRILHASGLQGLSTLDIDFSDGRLRLGGTLSSYHLKQMAQELAMKAKGVTHVENSVEVYRI
jgi:osmotically-inducible protein OsmY